MLVLRFAAVLGLVFWMGGLAALALIAAPALFDVVGTRGPDGRALAGAAFGETLSRFQTTTYVCAAMILTSLVVRGVLGPRPRQFFLRLLISSLMTVATAWSGFVLLPQIRETQRALGASSASASVSAGDGDALRLKFGRLHGISASLQLVPLIGGLVLIFFELKD